MVSFAFDMLVVLADRIVEGLAMDSDVRVLSDSELWRLLVAEFGTVRLVKMLGWLQFWLWFPGTDFRRVVEEGSSYATSYRAMLDAQRMLQVWARAEGREHQYTLHDLAERMQAIRRGGVAVDSVVRVG